MNLRFKAIAGLATLIASPAAFPTEPFVARYEVTFRGMRAGSSEFVLEKLSGSKFRYVSKSNARGLFRLALSHEILQSSEFEIVDGRVRPLEFSGDDGSSDTRKDVKLSFDWSAKRVHGVEEDKPIDLALEPEVQDALSAQVALMRAASEQKAPRDYRLVNDGHFDLYRTVAEGNARLETAAGTFDTVVFRSRREGAKHSIRIWLAPALGYIPVQAEQLREDKRVWIMRVSNVSK